MDTTPSKSPRARRLLPPSTADDVMSHSSNRVRKPPPITPRRFTRFFTPRPRHPARNVKTSRAALRAITKTALNTRQNQKPDLSLQHSGDGDTTPRGRKRKLSFVLAESSASSSPAASKPTTLNISHDLIRSSPTIPERCTPIRASRSCAEICDSEEETDVEGEDDASDEVDREPVPRIATYKSRSKSGNLLSTMVTGRRQKKETTSSWLWQDETAHFCSSVEDVNAEFTRPNAALPFSTASCHTNTLVAIGDEEGRIRLLDSANTAKNGMTCTWLTMEPHDNALMDLEFSPDDQYLATASGDQTCQIIDVPSQKSLYLLGDHRCSVKKIAFQPGSGNQILASCGRDGQVNFWDLRCKNVPRHHVSRRTPTRTEMTFNMRSVAPTHMIRGAHMAGSKAKPHLNSQYNMVPGRNDFSVTSLSFLGATRQNLLVTVSEIDSTIKLWDIRSGYGSLRRAPNPVSIAAAPTSHAHHRPFGITSIALSTDASRLFSLSRDNTVYAYSTSHLILGSSNQLSQTAKISRATESHRGLGPLYGFRHPRLHVQTFWTRLAIRKAADNHPELLAVASSDDCAVLFPTNERYLTNATKEIPPLHQDMRQDINSPALASGTMTRPTLLRSSSSISFNHKLNAALAGEGPLPIYQHGTPLIRGHDKEVTSLTWSSEGHLITASDDYTVRCWRERPDQARELRLAGEENGSRWQKGWSDVGLPGYDDNY